MDIWASGGHVSRPKEEREMNFTESEIGVIADHIRALREEGGEYDETPEARWARMRVWVAAALTQEGER